MEATLNHRKQIAKGATPLKWEDFKSLLFHLENDGNYTFALLALLGCTTGFRISDLLSLKWSQLIDREYLTITEKKTTKERTVKLNAHTQIYIRKYFKALQPVGEFVFVGRRSNGKPFSSQYVNKMLKQIKASYPLDHKGQFSTHTFRKTFGKRLYDQAQDKANALIHISKIFNHSSIDITREYIGIEAQDIEAMFDNIW